MIDTFIDINRLIRVPQSQLVVVQSACRP